MSRRIGKEVHPPKECPFCHTPRLGVQERRVYFKCGSILDYNTSTKPKLTRSLKCLG